MEKEVIVGEKKYLVKEVKYKDLIAIGQVDQATAARKLLLLSTNITDEEYDQLSMKEGVAVMKVVNELNGLSEEANFQKR